MSFVLRELTCTNWRNFQHLHISLGDKTTVLHGSNAVGKTNTIEAVQMITTGTSFRKPLLAQMIYHNENAAHLRGVYEDELHSVELECNISTHVKTYLKNEKKCSVSTFCSVMPSVLFSPDDLLFVKQTARYRRSEIDGFGILAHKGYRKLIKTFSRALEQRNNILKLNFVDSDMLHAWSVSLAHGSASVVAARLKLINQLYHKACEVYHTISPAEHLEITYKSSIPLIKDLEHKVEEPYMYTPQSLCSLSKEDLIQAYLDAFNQKEYEELRRQVTLIGPQRDDIEFYINGVPARTYASQGQQRSIVLAWKLAEVLFIKELTGQNPILLLDDVMSELDETRRLAIMEFIQQGIQTIITTTNLSYFTKDILDRAQVVNMNEKQS